MTTFDKPVISEPGAGDMAHGFGPHLIRMSADRTGGHLGLFETEIPAGEGPPLHVHAHEEEFFRVLSGRFLFVCGDSATELSEGGCVLLPRGIPHRFQNVGETAGRLMVMVTPGGFEGYFGAVEAAGMAELASVSERFGIRFVDTGATEEAA